MSVSRFFYEPFFSLDEFNRLFDEAFHARTGQRAIQNNTSSNAVTSFQQPRLDLHEGPDNTVTAQFELPGLKKEDVNIEVQNNRLTISGESKVDTSRNEEGYVMRERRYGKFSRTLPLPVGTETDKIKASVADGILTVTFPKATPAQGPKKITIA